MEIWTFPCSNRPYKPKFMKYTTLRLPNTAVIAIMLNGISSEHGGMIILQCLGAFEIRYLDSCTTALMFIPTNHFKKKNQLYSSAIWICLKSAWPVEQLTDTLTDWLTEFSWLSSLMPQVLTTLISKSVTGNDPEQVLPTSLSHISSDAP